MWIIPIVLGITAISLFYMANDYKGKKNISRFEMLFTFGNLFILASLLILYSMLAQASIPFYGVIYPLFGVFIFIFTISVFLIFLKYLLYVFNTSYIAITKRLNA